MLSVSFREMWLPLWSVTGQSVTTDFAGPTEFTKLYQFTLLFCQDELCWASMDDDEVEKDL